LPSKTYLGVPITVGHESIGVISMQNTERENVFSEADVRLLTTIAANVGAAIERARLYASAQEQKQYFESIVLYNPVAIVTVDPNATVLSWNPAAERLFGYTAAEAIGCNIDDLIATHPALHAEAVAYSQRTMSGDRLHVITRRNRKRRHAGGRRVWPCRWRSAVSRRRSSPFITTSPTCSAPP
jgi:PAS domain S-box-containing protein